MSFSSSVARWTNRLIGRASYGYDAVEDKKRRQAPLSTLQSEDKELSSSQRGQLVATARDAPRNFEVAAWMIRKHLDYVSTFGFKASTGVDPFDTDLEKFVEEASKKENFDAALRHPRRAFLRLVEARRVIDGDVGLLKLATGRLQAVEGDRIRNPVLGTIPAGIDPERLIHGVQVGKAGEAIAYSVCNRDRRGSGFIFDRMVSAENLILHGYFDRFDQTRGIAPLASAVNRLRDCYEGFDYALAKAKLAQLLALALYRNPDEEEAAGDVTTETDGDGAVVKAKTKLTFPGAAAVFDFDVGEKAEFIESQQPSNQFRDFTKFMIAVAMLALDIPYVFFDHSIANFTVSRHARLLYEQSCEPKQQDNRELLMAWLRWRLTLAVLDGRITLPAGMTVDDVVAACEWIAKGVPWVQPREEVEANGTAVDRGFTSTERVCKGIGLDAYAIVDEEARFQKYRRTKLGLHLPAPTASPQGAGDKQDEGDHAADS